MSSVLWTALSLNSKLEQFAQRVSVPQLERCNLQAAASQQASGSSDATADSDAAVTDYYSAADTTVGTGSVADDASSTGSHAASASASGSSGNTDDDKQAVVGTGTVLSWGQAPVSTGSLVSTNLNTLQTHWHFPRTTPHCRICTTQPPPLEAPRRAFWTSPKRCSRQLLVQVRRRRPNRLPQAATAARVAQRRLVPSSVVSSQWWPSWRSLCSPL